MPGTKYKCINRWPKACSWARDYNVIITLQRGLDSGPTLNHVPLSCSIPITTTITRISYICSHQYINDHHKKREPHTRHTSKQKG